MKKNPEKTTIKRKEKETEKERTNVIKLGSKLGGRKVIKKSKELSNIALSNSKTVWGKNGKES